MYKIYLKTEGKKDLKLHWKMGKNMNRQLTNIKDTKIALKHIKIFREILITTALRYHFSLIRLAKSQKPDKHFVGEAVGR